MFFLDEPDKQMCIRDRVKIDIDPATGALRSYIYKGKEMLSSPVVLSLYRPVTDTDSREKTGGAKVDVYKRQVSENAFTGHRALEKSFRGQQWAWNYSRIRGQ